jgi:hypothetical protein
VSDAVKALSPANVNRFVQKSPLLSVYMQIINQEYIAPDSAARKTGHKLKAMDN